RPRRNPSGQYVLHGVQPGRLAREEPGGLQGTPREAVSIERPMAEFHGLAHEREDDEMLPRTIGHPQRMDTDLVRPADPGLTRQAGDEPAGCETSPGHL